MRRCAARLSGISALLLCAACIHDQQDPVTLAPDQDAYIRFDQLLVSARKEQIAADRVYDGKIYMDSALTPALVSVPLVYRARQCGIDTASTRPMLEIFLAARGMPQPDVEEFMSFYDAGLATLAIRSLPEPCGPQEASDITAMFQEFNRIIAEDAAAPTFPDTLLADAGEASTPVMPPANAIWADTRTTGAGAATSRAPLPWTQPASNAAVQSGQGEVLPWQNSGTTSYSSSATNSGYYSRYATPEPYTPPTQADVRYAVQTDIGNATGVPVTEDQQRRASIDATGIDLTPWLQ
ncbi:MAG: hypothetical protein RJQ21_15575 [Rhodospirillales bacterium]